MTDRITLYTNPMSRGRIARWMLEEVGADYDRVLIGFEEEKPADFLKLNPMGKVPTILHGDTVVTECAAICAYLAETFPDAELAPRAHERADYYRWMFFSAGPVEAAIMDRALGAGPKDARQEMMAGYGSYDRTVATLRQAVAANDYIAGDRFTAADVYVGSHIMWGTQFGTLETTPEFDAYMARLTERRAYRRANELDDADMPATAEQEPAPAA